MLKKLKQKNKSMTDIHNSTDEFPKHHTEKKKPDT